MTESIRLLSGSCVELDIGVITLLLAPMTTPFQSPPLRILSKGDPMELELVAPMGTLLLMLLLLPLLFVVIPVIMDPLAIPATNNDRVTNS